MMRILVYDRTPCQLFADDSHAIARLGTSVGPADMVFVSDHAILEDICEEVEAGEQSMAGTEQMTRFRLSPEGRCPLRRALHSVLATQGA